MTTKVCKRTMVCVKKKCIRFLNILIHLTLYQFLGLILVCCIFIVICYKNSESSEKTILSKNPVILWWNMGFPGTVETKHCSNNIKCDIFSNGNGSKFLNVEAYLFYGSQIKFDDLPLPRNPKEVIWGLYHEESPRNVEEFFYEKILNLFNYSSTYSRHSDVPFPLQYIEQFDDITDNKYFLNTSTKNEYLKELAPIMYLQSDCETSTERDVYVKELMKFIKIDSYGACLKNKDLPEKFVDDYLNNLNEEEFLNFAAKYKFAIAIENGVCEDYITEKLWRAIKLGTVPIYFGSPSVQDWLPNNKSAILIKDFQTPKVLSDHIKTLLDNNGIYEEYLVHKTEQIVTNQRLIEEFRLRSYQIDTIATIEKFECFVCKKLHDKRQGKLIPQMVNKRHYDCPIPVSALTLDVNPLNIWVSSLEITMKNAKMIYESIVSKK